MTDSPSTQTGGKGRGCLFYGCLTLVVLAVVMCFLAFFTVRWLKSQIDVWTDTAPVELPKVEMADAEFNALQQRVQVFSTAAEQGKASQPLVLNSREINVLIARSPNGKEFADKIYVSLEGNKVKGQVSIPLNGLEWMAKGRYLNGEATFHVSLEDGEFVVTAQEIKVRGRMLPEAFMKALRKENLAKEIYKDPKNAEAIGKLESIQVEDSLLTIKARAAQ